MSKSKIIKISDEIVEKTKIETLLEDLDYKVILALMHELKNGKGIARIQAAEKLQQMKKEIEIVGDTTIKVNWDTRATIEAAS